MPRKRSEVHSYRDLNDKKYYLTNADLQDAVIIRNQLILANGHCNYHKLKTLLIKDGITKKSLKVCPGFRGLVHKYYYRYVLHDSGKVDTKNPGNHRKAKKSLPYSIKDEIGKYNYAKRESQDVARGYNKLRRHVTDTQIMRDQISKALSKAHFDFKVKHNENDDNKALLKKPTLLVSFSDLHVGAIVNIPQNHYNVDKAKQRVSEYCQKVTNLAKKYQVSDVYIANLGDDVENVYMRFTQGFDTQLSMSQQIVEAINIVCGMLVDLYNQLTAFGVKLHYTGIGGNHDRLNGNKKNSIYKDNVAIIINAAVERLAKLEFNAQYFEYIKPDDIYRTHLKINGDYIKIVHGDLDNLNKSDILGNMSVNDGRNYKLLLGGHLHRFSVMESGLNKYVVTSGSFKGPDDYSSKLGRVSSISQAAILINSNGQMTVENVELH